MPHSAPRYSVFTDKEAQQAQVHVTFKHGALPCATPRHYRRALTEDIFQTALNKRLFRISRQRHPPFYAAEVLSAFLIGMGDIVRGCIFTFVLCRCASPTIMCGAVIIEYGLEKVMSEVCHQPREAVWCAVKKTSVVCCTPSYTPIHMLRAYCQCRLPRRASHKPYGPWCSQPWYKMATLPKAWRCDTLYKPCAQVSQSASTPKPMSAGCMAFRDTA